MFAPASPVRLGVEAADAELASMPRIVVGDTPRLSSNQHRKPIVLPFAIAAFNQLSGIRVILLLPQ